MLLQPSIDARLMKIVIAWQNFVDLAVLVIVQTNAAPHALFVPILVESMISISSGIIRFFVHGFAKNFDGKGSDYIFGNAIILRKGVVSLQSVDGVSPTDQNCVLPDGLGSDIASNPSSPDTGAANRYKQSHHRSHHQ